MPAVTQTSQCFQIDGRPTWIVGASMQYALVPHQQWAQRLRTLKASGFNTVETGCPWLLHEPTPGRFDFEGPADLGHFLELCEELDLHVICRIGPSIGGVIDGGGLPGWLHNIEGMAIREGNADFLKHVERYFRALLDVVAKHQVTKGGSVLLVQIEHAWQCDHPDQVDTYLRMLVRMAGERGIDVPLINANDLWPDEDMTLPTWRDNEHLLAHLRQFATILPDRPRLVSALEVDEPRHWNQAPPEPPAPAVAVGRLAECLAAGAQPIVTPFVGGLCHGFLGGRHAGAHGTVATTPFAAAPIDVHGRPTTTGLALRRLAMFASQFGAVFADLDPTFQPVAVDLESLRSADPHAAHGVAVVSQLGSNGRVVFAFADDHTRQTTLVLDSGLHMPVHFGDIPVTWLVLDVDLAGRGRLNYTNMSPFAMVDRSVVIFHGPAGTSGFLSIDDTPIEVTVPKGRTPLIMEHGELTLVICNETLIDATWITDDAAYVGAAGITVEDEPMPHDDFATMHVIRAGHDVSTKRVKKADAKTTKKPSCKLATWQAAPSTANVEGTAPRYATLGGPETLTACGAMHGYGWYRMQLRAGSTKKHTLHMPQCADRAHLYVDGAFERTVGDGPGAERGPFDLQLTKGEHTIVALLDNFGRFTDGNDMDECKGLFGHIVKVDAMNMGRPRTVDGDPIDPFALSGYIAGLARGRQGAIKHLEWTFEHRRKTSLLLEIIDAELPGVFALNDEPLALHHGSGGRRSRRIMLDRENHPLKRGKNVLRFAPIVHEESADDRKAFARCVKLYDCDEVMTEKATWGFAKWETPTATQFKDVTTTTMKKMAGVPCWWRTSFKVKDANTGGWSLQLKGMSKGQVFLNGQNIGRYFVSDHEGKTVGPQLALDIPEPWVNADDANELLIFDEHGAAPGAARVVHRERI